MRADEPEEKLCAFALYSDPVVPEESSKRFDTFIIEFRASEIPKFTYWALGQWPMDITDFKSKYYNCCEEIGKPEAQYMLGYGGLQHIAPEDPNENDMKGIMSFWQLHYSTDPEGNDQRILKAESMYPDKENPFDGEGEGTQKIVDYDWHENNWYKMIFHCWTDAETGKTFFGQWIQDMETQEWTLLSYYNLNIENSSIINGAGFFLENYSSDNSELVRDFNLRNMYIRDITDKKWYSLDRTVLSYNKGANATGRHDFGVKDGYFYGIAGGTVENQEEYERNSIEAEEFQIDQDPTPELDELVLMATRMKSIGDNKYKIEWVYDLASAPQESYSITTYGNDGGISRKVITRPEETSYIYEGSLEDLSKIELTVYDIFGKSKTTEIKLGETIIPKKDKPKPQGGENEDPESKENEEQGESENKAEEGSRKTSNKEVETKLPNAGAKTVVPFIIVAITIAVIMYKKYKEYKKISK